MPNGKTHRVFGTVTGAVIATHKARSLPPAQQLIEGIGGALGGRSAAIWPDLIDPPTSPNHRSVGHGFLATTVMLDLAYHNLDHWQAQLRNRAEEYARLRDTATDPLTWCWYALCWALCHLASGALAGVMAGYASHIALDALTPKGLPLFG